MKLLVLSDIHAFQGDRQSIPSLVNYSDADRSETSDPILGLREFLQSNPLEKPDILVCAGDIADRADPIALKQAWQELDRLYQDFEIETFVATCGNHDLDTRHQENKFDPKGYLRKLAPCFPMPTVERNGLAQLKFWSNNFSILEGDEWRILNINSCAYHGYGPSAEPELVQGRISDHTIDDIKAELRAVDGGLRNKLNICLVHHHLKELHNDRYADKSRMKGSENLLSLLSQSEFGEWFVIHGHVHRGDLYSDGGNSGPIILSCASFSVSLADDPLNPSANQFYIVEFDKPTNAARRRIRGKVRAWDWAASYGWQMATYRRGNIGPVSGFGFRGDIPEFAQSFLEYVREKKKVTWEDAVMDFQELKNFLPGDLSSFFNEIEADGDIKVSKSGEFPREIVLR